VGGTFLGTFLGDTRPSRHSRRPRAPSFTRHTHSRIDSMGGWEIRIACLVTLIMALACASASAPWKRSIRGSVVAYDQMAALTKITSAPQVDFLIVKVEGNSRPDAAGSFKKILLHGFHGEPLPQELFEQGHRWRFAVSESRDLNCTAPLPYLKWLDEQAKVDAPDLTRIECLDARRSSVKMLRKP
jgi:hypothetical protein